MRVLRKTWERTLREALKLLEAKDHPIAQYTFKVIQKGTLKIIPFNKLLKNDFQDYLDDYHAEKEERLPHHYPPSKGVIDKMTDNWNAKINGNRISISHRLTDPKKIAKLLIHEVNHYLNNSNDNYETPQQIFEEELRAHVAPKLVFSRPLRTSKLKRLAKRIAKNYEVPLPKEIKIPEGLFVPR